MREILARSAIRKRNGPVRCCSHRPPVIPHLRLNGGWC